MVDQKVIVVGLGTAGAATCLSLARQGVNVLGIDRYKPPHSHGSHHGESRSVRRAYLEGTAYVPMARRAWTLWRQLERDTGVPLLAETGNLTIGPEDCPAVCGFIASARAYDIPHAVLQPAEVHRRWPQFNLPETFVAGLELAAGIVRPEKAINCMLAEAQAAGACLRLQEKVTGWREWEDHVEVRTEKATYRADRLLLSVGAWSGRMLGQPALQAQRVTVSWLTPPGEHAWQLGTMPVNFWQVPDSAEPGGVGGYSEFYTLPALVPGGLVKAAFHNNLPPGDPDAPDPQPILPPDHRLEQMLKRFLPALSGCASRREHCFYSMSPDGHFYLGLVPGCDRVVAASLAGHGFKFAPVLGEMLSDLLLERSPQYALDLFAPQRLGQC